MTIYIIENETNLIFLDVIDSTPKIYNYCRD